MNDQPLPGLDFAFSNTPLASLDLGPLGILKLDGIRRTVLRAGRLAEIMFGAMEADVIAVQAGRLWRGKVSRTYTDDALARELALNANDALWVGDTLADPAWRDNPAVRGAKPVRFIAVAPIRMRGGAHLGALRVVDHKPRAFDPILAAGLDDLAAFVADECDRLLEGEVRRLRELFDQAPGFMAIVTGPDHVFDLVNRAYLDLVGHRELIGRPLSEAIPEVGPQGFNARLDEVYRSGQPYVAHAAEVMLRRRPGEALETFYIDFVYQPIRDADGSISGVFVQGNDVTREKLAADDLQASARDLATALSITQTILDQSFDVISAIDANGIFTNVSQQAERAWGYRCEDLVGRPYIDLVHPDDRAATNAIASTIKSGNATTAFSNRLVHKDGTVLPVMWSAVWSEEHDRMFVIARDMREHEAAESMLRQAQKMEAVGQLTGGVAHDFNNLLTVVIGSSETLAEALLERPDLRATALMVLEAAERGAELVSRLLAYSRKQPLAARSIECKPFLEGLTPILARTLGEDVEVDMQAESGVYCLADPTQLTSALLNLGINSRDAMPAGGRLKIRARRVPVLAADEPAFGQPRPHRARPARTRPGKATPGVVEFSVEDTGTGMAADVVARVLEPFFTTKPAGLGSGLGLSMVYGFAKQSGGDLQIHSEPGRGTRVSIHIPEGREADTALAVVSLAPAQAPQLQPGHHILLVEDDDLVRQQAQSHLAVLGYRVTGFANGRDALDFLLRSQDVDLLLTDIVMPGGMNGRELSKHARTIIPSLRVVFTSGYSSDAVRRAEPPDARSQFLGKPYRRAELARVLLEAFDEAPLNDERREVR